MIIIKIQQIAEANKLYNITLFVNIEKLNIINTNF